MYQQAEQEALLGMIWLILLDKISDRIFSSWSWSCKSTWWSVHQWSPVTGWHSSSNHRNGQKRHSTLCYQSPGTVIETLKIWRTHWLSYSFECLMDVCQRFFHATTKQVHTSQALLVIALIERIWKPMVNRYSMHSIARQKNPTKAKVRVLTASISFARDYTIFR